MTVAVLKYNAGNVCSVRFALERLGANFIVTDNAEELSAADKVIIPGVGEASSAMAYLQERQLDVVIKKLCQPVLGICLGMQLMCDFSEENNTKCLGIFNQHVKLFQNSIGKVPQIGWNNIGNLRSPLFHNISDNDFVYFVHSYYAELSENTIAVTNYGCNYSAALWRDNFYAMQFHPEKSGQVGQRILNNFLNL